MSKHRKKAAGRYAVINITYTTIALLAADLQIDEAQDQHLYFLRAHIDSQSSVNRMFNLLNYITASNKRGL
jgi:hypothetical protein